MSEELPKWQKLPGDAGDIHVDFGKVPVNAYVTFMYPGCPDEKPLVVVRRGRYGLMLTENMAKDLLAELAAGFGYSLTEGRKHPTQAILTPPAEPAPVWVSECGRAIVKPARNHNGKYVVVGPCCGAIRSDGNRSPTDVGSSCPYDSVDYAIQAAKKRLRQMDMENTDE